MLREREAPTRFLYLWEAFGDLARARRAGISGSEPIGLDQLLDWQALFGFPLHRWEIDVIYRIDAAWREAMIEKPKDKPKG